jgi:hypothetical protein
MMIANQHLPRVAPATPWVITLRPSSNLTREPVLVCSERDSRRDHREATRAEHSAVRLGLSRETGRRVGAGTVQANDLGRQRRSLLAGKWRKGIREMTGSEPLRVI